MKTNTENTEVEGPSDPERRAAVARLVKLTSTAAAAGMIAVIATPKSAKASASDSTNW
ncbi:hypothetical protein C8J27_106270 [Rhodobacter aestuarii]|uniref:Uncharacterized protein n=1 Tax=Rhodobacter aestuarii TaxID=453582 RepID=A0A1N7MCW9_9RHOB|nr:hypothetical protein [Rhodobacter aestuarii]PTV95000.1 hypothetical protein C8J27_106270 [Rhodobacter aestuarii]SIS83912.1 hypothetical protein SAMN05421580_105270 [Rhodobacter aestuarii]